MNSFKRNFKIFLFFSRYSFKTIFQGRLGIVFFMTGKVIRFVFFLFLINLIFTRVKLIQGYSLDQAIIFYLSFNIIDTAAQILFREVYRFRYLVVSGNLDHVLLKPYHPFVKILVGGVDFLDLFLIVPYFALTLFFIIKIPTVSLSSFFFYLLLLCNSLLITTGFHIIVLALGILTTQIDHTILIFRDLTALGRFPIEIYKEPIRGIFTFIIPIAIMMSFPPKALFNILSPQFFAFSFVVSCIILFFSLKLWDFSLKRYQSYGG